MMRLGSLVHMRFFWSVLSSAGGELCRELRSELRRYALLLRDAVRTPISASIESNESVSGHLALESPIWDGLMDSSSGRRLILQSSIRNS